MVFTASLNVPVKKALKKQVISSNVNKICDNLVLDPDTTRMTVVILGPKDFVGPKAVQLAKALSHKHPNICVLYLYSEDSEEDLCSNCYKEKVRKITDKSVLTAFEKYIGDHMEATGQKAMSSADFDSPDDEPEPEPAVIRHSHSNVPPIPQPDDIEPGDDDDWPPQPQPGFGTGFDDDDSVGGGTAGAPDDFRQPTSTIPLSQPDRPETLPLTGLGTDIRQSTPAPTPEPAPVAGRLEERLASVGSYQEWELFKESLRHDTIVSELIMQNSEYEGLIAMLETLDTRIQAVWRDSTKTPDQKFSEIKQIGLQKSTLRAGVNAINVEKAISIISTIVMSAQRTVDERLNTIDEAMYKISSDSSKITDTSYIDKAIQQRTSVQLELLEIGRGILDIYKSTQELVNSEIAELDKNLPSSNQFINEMTKPVGTQIFTPSNTAELVKKISTAMQENRLVWSQLQERVDACIDAFFALCQADEQIIQYQQNMINMLMSNKVENVVIADTLLKRVLRVYTGVDNTGRSSTTITWSGVLSRRGNVLLIDLTGRSKFREYGITPVLLSDFLINRIERPMLCVETRGKLTAEEITEMISQIRTRLNYYQYVNVIVAPEDIDSLKQLCEEALVVHYITNCSTVSINELQNIVKQNDVENVARKLIIIDTPISPLTVADNIGIDPTNTKLIALPALNEIRACALKHDRPYDYPEIVRIYEEAFR